MLGTDLASKRKRKRSDYGYHLDYRTRWSDNDMYGHMNNSVYSFLIDSIANGYLIQQCGLEPTKSSEIGLVVSSYCDYFGSIAYPAVVDLGLRVVKLGKTSVLYEVGFFEKDKEEVKAVGGFVHVFVGKEGMRPGSAGMSARVREGLERLVEDESASGKAKL
ncbi:MAG: hypothetical protein Q9227_003387 [Pyrenula ochraceoflavens]